MISRSSRPVPRGGLWQSDLNDGCILYDRTRETTYTLNLTASLIWSYLDGALSLEDIAGEVSPVGGPGKEAVLRDIVETVCFFQRNELLDPASLAGD